MGGMLTSVAIVLPEKIYNVAARLRSNSKRGWAELAQNAINKGEGIAVLTSDSLGSNSTTRQYWELSTWEMELIERLNTFGLAR